jgi:hypothetical protein
MLAMKSGLLLPSSLRNRGCTTAHSILKTWLMRVHVHQAVAETRTSMIRGSLPAIMRAILVLIMEREWDTGRAWERK